MSWQTINMNTQVRVDRREVRNSIRRGHTTVEGIMIDLNARGITLKQKYKFQFIHEELEEYNDDNQDLNGIIGYSRRIVYPDVNWILSFYGLTDPTDMTCRAHRESCPIATAIIGYMLRHE